MQSNNTDPDELLERAKHTLLAIEMCPERKDRLKALMYVFDERAVAIQAAEQRGIEKAVVKIMGAKTEGLFDEGDLFIKRAPIEQAVVDLIGFEKFKAIQESLPAVQLPKDKGEE